MKTFFLHIKLFVRRSYHLLLSAPKQDAVVWANLKQLHIDNAWKSGVYEHEKYIESVFEISKGMGATYYYMLYDRMYHCRVKVLDHYTPELTTDVFVLAAHFNNLLGKGKVAVNVRDAFVEYHYSCDVLVPLIYNDTLETRMLMHYDTSKDIYWAFSKLLNEHEAPAIIISDLIKRNAAHDDGNDE